MINLQTALGKYNMTVEHDDARCVEWPSAQRAPRALTASRPDTAAPVSRTSEARDTKQGVSA
jgi:hypothetical protein